MVLFLGFCAEIGRSCSRTPLIPALHHRPECHIGWYLQGICQFFWYAWGSNRCWGKTAETAGINQCPDMMGMKTESVLIIMNKSVSLVRNPVTLQVMKVTKVLTSHKKWECSFFVTKSLYNLHWTFPCTPDPPRSFHHDQSVPPGDLCFQDSAVIPGDTGEWKNVSDATRPRGKCFSFAFFIRDGWELYHFYLITFYTLGIN